MITIPIFVAVALIAPPPPSPQPPVPPIGVWRSLSFESPAGRAYDARLWTPPDDAANGCAVLLIGGGGVTDMHWTISASYTIDGKTTDVTIDGRPTRDADTIAESLVRAGFAVMQWSSIHAADPMYRENTALAIGIPYAESVELAQLALRTLREQPGIDPDRIVLLGHSLGATRACQIADEGVAAMVFLAGAYLSRVEGRPSGIAAGVWAEVGADPGEDGVMSPDEFRMWHAADNDATGDRAFTDIDQDGDGAIRDWELAAAARLARLDDGDTSVLSDRPMLRPDHPWPSDVLGARPVPTLALFAGLDPMSIHGPILGAKQLAHVHIGYVPARNHQFAVERDGRFGPIDAAVVARLTAWLKERCPGG